MYAPDLGSFATRFLAKTDFWPALTNEATWAYRPRNILETTRRATELGELVLTFTHWASRRVRIGLGVGVRYPALKGAALCAADAAPDRVDP